MTISAALRQLEGSRLRPSNGDVRRALLAGAAWGLVFAAGWTAMTAWQCGGICVPEVAVTSALSLACGMLGIGPLAAYGRR